MARVLMDSARCGRCAQMEDGTSRQTTVLKMLVGKGDLIRHATFVRGRTGGSCWNVAVGDRGGGFRRLG